MLMNFTVYETLHRMDTCELLSTTDYVQSKNLPCVDI